MHIACRRRLVARLPKIPHLLSCFLLLPHSSPPLHSRFLATLFVGFSLTPTANLAGSDKALKSSAGVSHSGWAGPSWMRAVHRAEVGAHMAGGRGRKAPLPAVVGREHPGSTDPDTSKEESNNEIYTHLPPSQASGLTQG